MSARVVRPATADARQEFLDRFYFDHGPCCAGCDWWRSLNPLIGECTATAPISGSERAAALDIMSCSAPLAAGHALTKRDHCCGQFRDEFDWTSLPLDYRKRVGAL